MLIQGDEKLKKKNEIEKYDITSEGILTGRIEHGDWLKKLNSTQYYEDTTNIDFMPMYLLYGMSKKDVDRYFRTGIAYCSIDDVIHGSDLE